MRWGHGHYKKGEVRLCVQLNLESQALLKFYASESGEKKTCNQAGFLPEEPPTQGAIAKRSLDVGQIVRDNLLGYSIDALL